MIRPPYTYAAKLLRMAWSAPSPQQIRDARTRLNLTQAAAAELAAVSTRAWIKYESGERAISRPAWVLFGLRTAPNAGH